MNLFVTLSVLLLWIGTIIVVSKMEEYLDSNSIKVCKKTKIFFNLLNTQKYN